jgi:hypothetical protein
VTSSAGILPIDVLCPSLCIQTAMDADVPSCSGGRRRLHSLRHRPTKGRGRGVNEPPNWVSFPNFRNYRTCDGATNRIYSRRDALNYSISRNNRARFDGAPYATNTATLFSTLPRCRDVRGSRKVAASSSGVGMQRWRGMFADDAKETSRVTRLDPK